MKKALVWFLSFTLILSGFCWIQTESRSEKTNQNLAEYHNNEVLTIDQDGQSQLWTYANQAELATALQEFTQNEQIAWYQPNYTYQVASTNDPYYQEQWGLSNNGRFELEEAENEFPVYEDPFGTPSSPGQWDGPGFSFWGMNQNGNQTGTSVIKAQQGIDINVEKAWANYQGGKRPAIIALIDTGVDYTHEDLRGAIWTNSAEIPNNGLDDDQNGYIDDYYGWNFYNNNNQIYTSSIEDSHGTHCAGSMAASIGNSLGIAGIAGNSQVKVMALKALGGSEGSGSTEAVIKAIQYAEKNGAVICNLSLGSSENDQALYQAIANSSMLFVIASGNGDKWSGQGRNIDKLPCYPASYDLPNIISVANLQPNGELHYSSNYGQKSVDVAAPGSYILSTTPSNNYSYMSGTSMAAPMVAATAGLVYSQKLELTLPDVKEIILNSGRKTTSLSGKLSSSSFLNAGAALSYDTANLKHQGWAKTTKPVATIQGSPPTISFSTDSRNGEEFLVVTVRDPDNDLNQLRYANGRLTAEDFKGGKAGTAFSLEQGNCSWFEVDNSGSFTFYASDQSGQETVSTVTVTVDNVPAANQQTPNVSQSNPNSSKDYQELIEYMNDYVNQLFEGLFSF